MNEVKWNFTGAGQEAVVYIGNLKYIDGIGGEIGSETPISVAKRINHRIGDKPIPDFQGHDLFCKHLVFRILDDYFVNTRKYSQNHIPIPLGSFNDSNESGYYYKFVEGDEEVSLTFIDEDYKQREFVVDEWNTFIGLFNTFGIDLGRDITQYDDKNVGKNVIYSDLRDLDRGRIGSDWKRIDFGSASCGFDYDKFFKLISRETGMEKIYRELAILSAKYSQYRVELSNREKDIFDEFIYRHRNQSLTKILMETCRK